MGWTLIGMAFIIWLALVILFTPRDRLSRQHADSARQRRLPLRHPVHLPGGAPLSQQASTS
jgi:hypothetical protein